MHFTSVLHDFNSFHYMNSYIKHYIILYVIQHAVSLLFTRVLHEELHVALHMFYIPDITALLCVITWITRLLVSFFFVNTCKVMEYRCKTCIIRVEFM